MSSDDSLLLKIFQNLEKAPATTQRNLSTQLGVALGLTNMLLRRAVRQGWLKVNKTTAQKISYEVTKNGSIEKGRLMVEQIQQTLKFYNEARNLARQTLSDVQRQGVRKIAINGTSNVSEIIFLSAKEIGLEIMAFVDENKVGQQWLDLPCISIDELGELAAEILILDFLKAEELTSFQSKSFPIQSLI